MYEVEYDWLEVPPAVEHANDLPLDITYLMSLAKRGEKVMNEKGTVAYQAKDELQREVYRTIVEFVLRVRLSPVRLLKGIHISKFDETKAAHILYPENELRKHLKKDIYDAVDVARYCLEPQCAGFTWDHVPTPNELNAFLGERTITELHNHWVDFRNNRTAAEIAQAKALVLSEEERELYNKDPKKLQFLGKIIRNEMRKGVNEHDAKRTALARWDIKQQEMNQTYHHNQAKEWYQRIKDVAEPLEDEVPVPHGKATATVFVHVGGCLYRLNILDGYKMIHGAPYG